jgi:hypothetical protein
MKWSTKNTLSSSSSEITVQSNLSTTATLRTTKKWPLFKGGHSVEVFQSKLVLKLVWSDLAWLLLTSGGYSEVAANTGLTGPGIKWTSSVGRPTRAPVGQNVSVLKG